MAEFLMPILGADMTAGTLVAWRKQPGDRVERGDIIAEVESDKADVEVEIFVTGVLDRILVEPGTKVPVGTPLAIIREEGGGAAQPATPALTPAAAAPAPAMPAARRAAPAGRPAGEGGRLRVSPSARQLAQELAVDLSRVMGSGPDGRIMRRDIEEAAATGAGAPPAVAVDRQTRMRQAIAAAMARSAREIPHFHLTTTIDMSRAMGWLSEENLRRPVAERLLYGAILLKAMALALREVPELNATWSGERVVLNPAIHVGVAISLRQGGLVAPAIHDTDRQSLTELMEKFRDVAQRARAGSLRSSEMSDPTITMTSLGETGAESVFGLIYPPQVALVGFGRVAERAVSIKGDIVSHPAVTATLSADHRVADGQRGGVYLAALDRLLQEPSRL